MRDTIERIHFKYYSIAMFSIIFLLGLLSFGWINTITLLGGLGLIFTVSTPKSFLLKYEDNFKLNVFLCILVSLYSFVFQSGSVDSKYSYLIMTVTAIPLMSSFIKRKGHLGIFLLSSFVVGSILSYRLENFQNSSIATFLAFLGCNLTIYFLNIKRIDLEIKDAYRKNKIENLIKSLPETLVRCTNNSFEVLKMSKAKFSDEMKEFIISSFSDDQVSQAQFAKDNNYFNIKRVKTSSEEICLYYISDVTEEILKEKELEKNKHQLSNSSKLAALGEMAGGVAHEINNPLQILSLSVEQIRLLLAAEQMDPVACEKICEQMDSTIDRVNNIVKGMKLISRDGNQDPYEEVDVKQVVVETLSFCKEKFKNSGVKLFLYEEEHVSYKILGQKVRLSQVVLNLLNNAFDAISKNKNKAIRVSLGHNQENVFIAISDSGPGVPEELVEKIFQPFFTTKEIGKGTGLGLSISKGIIEQHKGSFYLDENNRSKFVIEIPLSGKGV